MNRKKSDTRWTTTTPIRRAFARDAEEAEISESIP